MNSRFALPCLLVAFFVLALAYSVVIPLGEAADEVPHFSYVQFLVLHHALPPPEGQMSGESHQPPLYYWLGALATSWVPQRGFDVIANPDFAFDDRNIPNLLVHDSREAFPYRDDALAWHLVRLLSIVLGSVTVWATWETAREIFPADAAIAFGAAAFVAFLPSFIALSAVVNNDNLIIALSSLSILQSVRLWHRGVNVRGAAMLGLLLGLAALTKLSAIVVWVFAALVFFLSARKAGNWRTFALPVALCFGIGAVIISPWVGHNLLQYGDPFAYSVYLTTGTLRTEPLRWREALNIVLGLFTSFWGRFGGAVQIEMAPIVYQALALAMILPAMGWVFYLQEARRQTVNPHMQTLSRLALLFWVPFIAVYVQWSLQDRGVGQARLLFPGLSLLAMVFVAGLARLFGARAKIALALMSVCLVGLSIGALVYLRSLFAAAV